MTTGMCPFESQVLEAARSEQWTATLRDHVAGCASCAESVDAVRAMASISLRALARVPEAPAARAIWLQAEFARRQRQRQRVEAFQSAALAALAAGGVAALLAWRHLLAPDTTLLGKAAGALSYLFPSGTPATAIVAVMMIIVVWMADRSAGETA